MSRATPSKAVPKLAAKTLPAPLMRPMNDRVLVDRDPLDLVTASGIQLLESSLMDGKQHTGRILAIGPRVAEAGETLPAEHRLQVGDRVWFRVTAGQEFTAEDGSQQILLRGCDLFAHEHLTRHS